MDSANLGALCGDSNFAINELRCHPRWLNWRYERRGDKLRKPPIGPDGRLIDATDPTCWRSFQRALIDFLLGLGDGIGIALSHEFGLVAVDLDDCIAGGRIDPAARDICRALDSYVEISPSGTGLRVLCWAALSQPIRLNRGRAEIYSSGGYVTLTGNCGRSPQPIRHRTSEVIKLADRLGGTGADRPVRGVTLEPGIEPVRVDDLRISPRMRRVIIDGGDYPSRSHAVWATINSLIAGGHSDPQIRSTLLDPEHGIAAKPLERGARWLEGEISRARAKAEVHRGGCEFDAL